LIYPTRTAIVAAALGAPIALAVALAFPGRWYAGLAWPAAVLVLVLFDALIGPKPRDASAELELPATASVGTEFAGLAHVMVDGGRVPASAELALGRDVLLDPQSEGEVIVPLDRGRGAAPALIEARRRGTARIERLWVRWRGRLGLVWKQRIVRSEASVAILPDISAVQRRGAEIFRRHALQGLLAQMNKGDGSDFDALVEFRSGMDRRAIDWKQSARHMKLHAKEFRTERNSQIVFAIDAGRQMTDPIEGLPRLDRAVSAVLQNAWVALKLGDRASLFAFDSRPRLASGFVAGAHAFGELQRLAARIDYSGEETNYTFALATLASRLARRSMIVLLTEFTDLTSAEFLVQSAARLLRTHLLLVVVLRDEDLERVAGRTPEDADDVTRAVTAAALLKERLLVLTRLRHLGGHVVECDYDRVGDQVVAAYLDLKRRNLL
jgi:uncharacterized protein (DUF58 family)